MDREGMDSVLTSLIEGVGVRGFGMTIEEVLLRHHQRMGYFSLFVLSMLYSSLYERANKEKLICDACELGKQTKSSYCSSRNRSSGVLILFTLMYGGRLFRQIQLIVIDIL
jgi:hypothetical protein